MNIQDPEMAPTLASHLGTPSAEEDQEHEIPPPEQRVAALEAMLFASPGPVRFSELAEATGWGNRMLEQDLQNLESSLVHRGIELQRVAGALRLVTSRGAAPFVERLIGVQTRRRLSRAQLETLAIVAYRQPVTRAQAEALRGVSCERLLGQLCDLRLIREVGRADLPGRPIIYGTTMDFLRYFGLNNMEQLPDLRELKRNMAVEGVSASQASWNAAARGDTERPEGFESVDVAPRQEERKVEEPHRMGAMQPLAAELAGAPSQGLLKLFNKIRGKSPATPS